MVYTILYGILMLEQTFWIKCVFLQKLANVEFTEFSQDEYVDSRNHTVENIIKTKRWDPQKQIHFQNNIDIEKMLELEHMLTLCSTEKDMITQDTVDILIENLCNIFVTSGQQFFGTYNVKEKNKNNTFKKENKPWFDLDCRFAR